MTSHQASSGVTVTAPRNGGRRQHSRGTSSSATKAPRRYAFACSNCRRKKIRCDGERPQCHNCIKVQETCGYAQTSTEVQLRRAQTRIRTLEDRLKALSILNEEEQSKLRSKLEHSTSPSSQLDEEASVDTESQEDQFWSQVGIDEDGTVSVNFPHFDLRSLCNAI